MYLIAKKRCCPSDKCQSKRMLEESSYFCSFNYQTYANMSVVVNQISKLYGQQKALNNVSLSIKAGEIVGLLGPNGAGKSTLMKILSCYLPPTSGTAHIMGYDVQLQSVEVRKLIGYLPESNPLYQDMYIREYLDFVADLHLLGNKKSSRVDEMIQLTGLEAELGKKIRMLSKGYKQRVGLAQALLHDPQVLILDEPTSGLDPNQLVDIRSLIKNVGENKTVILSTHIMQEVEALCSRVIIINKGELAADNSIQHLQSAEGQEQVYVEFDQPVTLALLKTVPDVLQVIKDRDGWILCSKEGKDIRQQLNKWAATHEVTILSLSKKKVGIEESFHRLTQMKS